MSKYVQTTENILFGNFKNGVKNISLKPRKRKSIKICIHHLLRSMGQCIN